jgi:hypothetical protein
MSSTTFYEPLERNPWFDYEDGIGMVKAEDDDIQVNWNLTDYLASGETVSSAAYEDSGVTTSSKSVSSPTITFTVTGLGYTTVTATLSTGRTVEKTFYLIGPQESPVPRDYR